MYEPVSLPPILTPREAVVLRLVAWGLAIFVHAAVFWIAGQIVEYATDDFEITMAWSDEPLMGFGMMEAYADIDAEDAIYEPPPQAEETDDPFETEAPIADAAPALDPNSIVIPEPEPETAPEKPILPHDLSHDKARLAAVREDVKSMPNLHVLAPGNARMIVLIRNDRVIGSRFENSVRRLFRAFPDYRVALGASEIDPVRDIQAMLIATADPRLYAETFLVVSHRIPAQNLKKYITASFPTRLTWQTHRERPLAVPDSNDGKFNPRSGIYRRALYLPDDQTVLFLKPEVLPTLDVSHVDAVHVRDKDLAQHPEEAQTFLASLGSIGTSDSISMPTIFLMLQGIEGIQLGRQFPAFEPPVAVVGSLSTADNPILNLNATFKTAESANQFVEIWPEIVAAAGRMKVPGVSGLLGALKLAPEQEQVWVTGELNGTMIGLVLMFAASYLERQQ